MAVDVGSAVGYLDLDISGFLANLRSAQSEANRTTQNMATSVGNSMTSVGKSLTTAGSTLTKSVTLPVVGLGTAIVTTSANFESAMSKVQSISGATGSDLDALTAKAREMGSKTKFSATESAEAFQYMAMAGWDVDDMLTSIEGVMNLAAASGEDLGTVSDIVTDAMTAFGLAADGTSTVLKDGMEVEVANCTRFVDALAAASNSSNTNVSMLGESFKYVAPVAGALGYSVEDVAVALGLMANQGIKSSQAGTALRTILTNMAKPTDQMAAAMDTLGVSLTDDEGNMLSLMEVMEGLREGFGGGSMDAEEFASSMGEIDAAFQSGQISEEEYEAAVNDLCVAMYGAEGAQKAQLAATLAGKTGMAGLLAIVNTTEEDFDSLTESIYNASGTSEEMANIMQDNLSGQLTILKSMLEELALQFGEILLPVIRSFVEWLQKIVGKLQEMSPEQREQIVKWAAIAAAIGPVLLAIGKLVTGIGGMLTTFGKIPAMITKLKSGFSALSAAIGGISAPVVAIIAVVAVLIAAFVNLWKNNEEFRNKITAIWDGLKKKFESFGQGIVDRLNALGFDFENFTEVVKVIWNGFCNFLAPIFEGVFNNISIIIGTVLDVITGIFDVFIGIFTGNWEQAWTGVKEIFGGIWNGIASWFENILSTMTGVLDVVCGWFGTTWEETWNSIKEFFVNIWNGIVSFFTNIIDGIKTAVSNFVSTIVNFFAQLPTNIANFITNAYNSVVTWVSNMVAKAREMGSNFLNSVVEFFTNLPYKIGYFIGSALGNVILWVTNMVNKAKEMGTNFLNQVVSFFTQLPGKILNFITSAWNNVTTWATNMVNKAKEMASNFLNQVVLFFTQLPGKILNFITSAWNNVTTWTTNMVNKAKEMAQNFLNNIVTFFTQLPGKVLNFITSAWNNVVTWATNMVNKAKEMAQNFLNNIVTFFTQLPGKIQEFITSALNNVKTWATNMVNQAKEAATNFLNNVKSTIQNLPSTIKTYLDSAITNLKTWVTDMGTKGKEAITSLINNVKTAAANIGETVKSIGSDIVNGVWNGIKAAKDSFVSSVKGFFSGIVDGVKDALGIGSPSKVFRDEIGRWMPAGAAVGFVKAMPAATKDMQAALDKGVDSLEADDISVSALSGVDTFANAVKSVYATVAEWFESIDDRIGRSVDSMVEKLQELLSIGQLVANPDGTLGYVGYNGFADNPQPRNRFQGEEGQGVQVGENGRVYVFYSQKAISEKEAAQEIKNTERDIAEGFLT